MKTLKQLREEYDDNFLSQVETPDELVLDEESKSITPSQKDMPIMLLFRRISYRIFPGKQVVALYYSKLVDKYLSIPFGPHGNLNLSEAEVLDSIDEDWQSVNRKDKTDGLSQKAVNAYRREHPGSKLKTAVTEKNPTGKRAARRKSFCSRMGGMKKRLTSAKTARDPDSRINKALRRWNCEEDFKLRLNELRIQQDEGAGWEALKGAAKGAWAGKSLGPGGMVAGALAGGTAGYIKGKYDDMKKNLDKKGDDSKQPTSSPAKSFKGFKSDAPHMKTHSSWEKPASSSDATFQSKLKQAELKQARQVNENKISDIRKMIKENQDDMGIIINGRPITLNTSMAKRILEVYDSVNTKNKRIVEGMLNEDLESFKKLLNFSIRN